MFEVGNYKGGTRPSSERRSLLLLVRNLRFARLCRNAYDFFGVARHFLQKQRHAKKKRLALERAGRC